jgi:hypothetical protein
MDIDRRAKLHAGLLAVLEKRLDAAPRGSPGFSSIGKVRIRRSFSGFQSRRSSVFVRRLPAKRCVRAALVVVLPPGLDLGPGVCQGQEPVRVQALIAKPSIERLHEGVVGRLARAAEVQRDGVLIGPAVECLGDELRTVVDPDRSWCPADHCGPRHRVDDLLALDALIDLDRQGLARISIDHGQRSQPSSIEQCI